MPDFLAPGVYVEELSTPKPIQGVATSTAAFIGVAEQGPLDEATLVYSYMQFLDLYGGPLDNSYLAHSAYHFFKNGGQRLYIARVTETTAGSVNEADYQAAFSLLDVLIDMSLIAVPGMGSASMIDFAANYCEQRRDCFFIADTTVADNSFDGVMALADAVSNKNTYVAMYFPWINVRDIDTAGVVSIPPSGAVAGIYATIDALNGVWKAPAGTTAVLSGVEELSLISTNEHTEELNNNSVNSLVSFKNNEVVVWGARTLHLPSQSEFRYVPVRRLEIYIEQSIKTGIDWAVFEANNESLWAQLRGVTDGFLNTLYRSGALQGSRPSDAYFVKCDSETTTLQDIENGTVNIIIGFAPLKPAEFVIIKIGQKTMG